MAKLDGFYKYKEKNLPKVNSLRLANSLVNITTVPILDKGSVLFSPGASAHDEPRSCYNCHMFNSRASTCSIMGPQVRVEKFIYPSKPEKDSKPIEYWPVCGMWDYGTPNEKSPAYKGTPYAAPDNLGFGWVNAPEVGQEYGGTACGGGNGADECDHYLTPGPDKREPKTGFCRVLQSEVGQMDCCVAWGDDDFVEWQDGQKLLEDLDKEREQLSSPNPFVKR